MEDEIVYCDPVQDGNKMRVLLQRDKVFQRMFNLDVPFMNDKVKEINMIKTIFSKEEVLENAFGYKVVSNNAEHQIQITKVNDILATYQYVVNLQSRKIKPQESNNFSNLLNSKKFSDVTLSVGGRVIHAHKNILANKSPVFDAMFMHEMQESRSSQVEIKELDYETMYNFLHYLYAGKFREDCTNNAFARYSNLLRAADRYCVESLKRQCEEKLVTVLTTENVLECLALADLHNTTNLKKKVNDFIVENADKIIESPSFKSFLLLHPDLSIEIIRALIVEKNNLKLSLAKEKTKSNRHGLSTGLMIKI